MTVVVFGAGGQLGQECSLHFKDAIAYTRDQVDITDSEQVSSVLRNINKPLVINAAAYSNVELAETEVASAYLANALGSLNIARETESVGGTLIQFSTDYVFDGMQEVYTEKDLPNPLNVYGLSKLSGEMAVATFCSNFYIIRTSALFGMSKEKSNKNFILKRVEQILNRQEIRMVSDQLTVPTYTKDLVNAIEQLLARRVPFGIYNIVNNGGAVSWFDLTKIVADLMGEDANIIPISSDESLSVLKRPKKSVLSNQKIVDHGVFIPDWQASLGEYLTLIKGQINLPS